MPEVTFSKPASKQLAKPSKYFDPNVDDYCTKMTLKNDYYDAYIEFQVRPVVVTVKGDARYAVAPYDENLDAKHKSIDATQFRLSTAFTESSARKVGATVVKNGFGCPYFTILSMKQYRERYPLPAKDI